MADGYRPGSSVLDRIPLWASMAESMWAHCDADVFERL